MTEENGKSKPVQLDPVTQAAETLLYVAQRLGKPVVMAVNPEENSYNLKPGQVQGSASTELRPSCYGLVIAIAGSTEEMQGLLDVVMEWNRRRESDAATPDGSNN